MGNGLDNAYIYSVFVLPQKFSYYDVCKHCAQFDRNACFAITEAVAFEHIQIFNTRSRSIQYEFACIGDNVCGAYISKCCIAYNKACCKEGYYISSVMPDIKVSNIIHCATVYQR